MSKKDTSQKFFTIQFYEHGLEEAKTTKVPARKGKSLKESLEPILQNHNLSFETHSVFLDSSNTPLPLTSETFPYGGHILVVKANEQVKVDKRIFSMRKDDGKKSPETNKRFSSLLKDYETNGFEDEIFDATDGDSPKIEEVDEFFLETSWKDVITETENITDRQRVQQEAIWELLSTEITFIKDIKIVIDIFQKCFLSLQKEGYLTEIDQSVIYANINEIYEVNVSFWNLVKRAVENARLTKLPIKPSQLVQSFEEFEELFQPYITFCNADTSNMKIPNCSQRTNEMLKEYFSWCDNHEKCKRIKLAGFLIKPLQRVTKYSLLIRAILNKTDDEKERFLMEDMMSRVETFVSKINSAVHMRQEYEKLISVLAKFDTYCPQDAVNDETEKIMSEYCNLDLKGNIPGVSEDEKRFLLKDGPMKLVEKQTKKDVHAFLFSDVFVLTKLKRNIDKYRIIRQPFRLNKVELKVLKDPGSFFFIYLNEYGVMANAFVLQINPSEQAKWLSAFQKAKKEYEIVRNEYGYTKEDFFDDDLPNSVICKNKVRKRNAQNLSRSTSKSPSKDFADSTALQWTNWKLLFGATVFCLFNVFLARLFGFK